MIEEKQVIIRTQHAEEGNWLYKDNVQGDRTFTKTACLGANAEPWAECTDEEKKLWEEVHNAAEVAVEDVQDAEEVE